MNENSPEMTERTLKEFALIERIGELTKSYEEKIIDLRVTLTEQQNHYEKVIGDMVESQKNKASEPGAHVVNIVEKNPEDFS